MKRKLFGLLALAFLALPSSAFTATKQTKATVVKSDYDCATDFSDYFASKSNMAATSKYWMHEALNTAEFVKDDCGLALANDTTGKLPLLSAYSNEFSREPLSLKTYPLRTSDSRVSSGVKYFIQDPAGWKMTNNSNPGSVVCWPEDQGYCSADSTNFKVYENGQIVFGKGMGLVTYFYAPKDGIINISDAITVPSDDTDGIYLSMFQVKWTDLGLSTWNWNTHASLCGAKPLWPAKDTKVSSDYTTGWQAFAGGETNTYSLTNIEVEKYDLIAFVYSTKDVASTSAVTSSPKISYTSSPDMNEDYEEYSASKDFPGADGNYYQTPSSGVYPWSYQALNTRTFYEEGLIGVNSETGQLSTDDINNLGLQMYSTFRNTSNERGDTSKAYPGHVDSETVEVDYLYAYPAGYRVAYNDSDVGKSYSGGGVYTASQQWMKIGGGQWIHPGYNVAVATCFFAPKSGTINISDSIYIPDYGSDGMDIAIYHESHDYLLKGRKLWSSGDAFGLWGATPVYPTPGVNINPDNTTGWLHVPSGRDFKYKTGAINVEKDDMIVILYSQHESTAYDTTYTSPTIAYVSVNDSVALDHYNEPIRIGQSLQLTATILPPSSKHKTITWTSDDPTIATVDENGLVTGVGEGTTCIWATLDSGAKAYCLFKVSQAPTESAQS